MDAKHWRTSVDERELSLLRQLESLIRWRGEPVPVRDPNCAAKVMEQMREHQDKVDLTLFRLDAHRKAQGGNK